MTRRSGLGPAPVRPRPVPFTTPPTRGSVPGQNCPAPRVVNTGGLFGGWLDTWCWPGRWCDACGPGSRGVSRSRSERFRPCAGPCCSRWFASSGEGRGGELAQAPGPWRMSFSKVSGFGSPRWVKSSAGTPVRAFAGSSHGNGDGTDEGRRFGGDRCEDPAAPGRTAAASGLRTPAAAPAYAVAGSPLVSSTGRRRFSDNRGSFGGRETTRSASGRLSQGGHSVVTGELGAVPASKVRKRTPESRKYEE